MGDFDIGDMGSVDQFGLPVDIPEPQLMDDSGMAAGAASLPGGFTASLAEVGLGAAGAAIAVEDGAGSGFSGSLDVMAFSGDQLGSLPGLEEAPPPAVDQPFTPDAQASSGPMAFSAPGDAAFSDAPATMDAAGVALGGLPDLEPPPAPDPSFAGVNMAPSELLDLQMTLTPPEPSQEGFSQASDAPMPGSFSIPSIASSEHQASSLFSASHEISDRVWGPMASSAVESSSRASGRGVHIENLHLPAASSNELLDQLLGAAPGLSNSDLSALG